MLNAGGWLVVGYGLNLTIRFGSNLLMTRLLVPEMFGVMSIAVIVLVGLAMFSDFGLKQCIVQSERGHDPAFLGTAWLIQALQGALLWLIALGISLAVFVTDRIGTFPQGSVYASPILPQVIAILSSGVLIAGLGSTKFHEASRRLMLGRVAQVEIMSQIVGLACMLTWVAFDRSIWALVSGAVSSAAARTCLSHVWLPGPVNLWRWDASAFREIIRFGKWMFLSSILGFLVNNGDRLLLGGLVDSHVLGLYAIAYLLFSVIEQVLGTIIGELVFPALSEIIRENRADLKARYYRFQLIIASLSYAISGITMGAGQAIVDLIYDRRYRQAGLLLEILAVGLLAIPWRSATLCLLALGKPQIMSYTVGVRLLTLCLAVPIGFHAFGLTGAVWGVVIAQLVCVPLIAAHMLRTDMFDVQKEVALLLIAPASLLVAKATVFAIGLVLAADVSGVPGALHFLINSLAAHAG
jgi:O-antigen/teichoic acid export membrane protein